MDILSVSFSLDSFHRSVSTSPFNIFFSSSPLGRFYKEDFSLNDAVVITTLTSLHYGFLVRPWHKNITKALRKEPKWFLRDWSEIEDPGKRAETFCACHLLKAVEGWTDLGLGSFALRYIRDKQQREVDFLVTRDDEPWILVEAKLSDTHLSPHLTYFQKCTRCAYAFQIVINNEFIENDCFTYTTPTVVPARTLFSQLL